MGLGMTAIAVALFSSQSSYHNFYWALHSLWHADAAFGQAWILVSRWSPRGAQYAALDYPINKSVARRIRRPLLF
jgi:hypothetical protein